MGVAWRESWAGGVVALTDAGADKDAVAQAPHRRDWPPTVACAVTGAAALVLLVKTLWGGSAVSGSAVALLAGLLALSLLLLCWVEVRSGAAGPRAAGPAPAALWLALERTLVTLGYFALFGAVTLGGVGSGGGSGSTSPLLIALTGGLGVVLTAWFGSHRDAAHRSTAAKPEEAPKE